MIRFISLVSIALVSGCGDRVDQAQSNVDRAAELACEDCYGAFFIYDTAEACYEGVDDTYGLTDVEKQCLRDVLGREPTAADYYDCVLEAQADVNACFDMYNDPCNNDEMLGCLTDFNAAAQECDETYLSDSAREALQECVN